MSVLVDTSAFLALLEKSDINHERADRIWRRLFDSQETLVTTNYVLLETLALLQRRLGTAAVRGFSETFVPLLEVAWIDASEHYAGVASLLNTRRRHLSLVDIISCNVMRRLNIKSIFAFDIHFEQAGFESVA